MADEERKPDSDSKSQKEGEDTEDSPKGSLKKLIVIGVVVLLLGGGGFAGWKFFLAKDSSSEADKATAGTEKAPKVDIDKPGYMYEMKPFIVNLVGHRGQRYLKTKIIFEIDLVKDIQKELSERTPELRDAMLLLLSSKSFEDVNNFEGKIQLRNELIVRINQVLRGGDIRGLYFTEFVVQ